MKKPLSKRAAKVVIRVAHATSAASFVIAGIAVKKLAEDLDQNNTPEAVNDTLLMVSSIAAGTFLLKQDSEVEDHFIDHDLLKIC